MENGERYRPVLFSIIDSLLSSSCNRGYQQNPIAFVEGRFQTLQVFDVLIVQEQVDEGAQLRLPVEQVRAQRGVLGDQIVHRRTHCFTLYMDLRLPVRIAT